MTASFSRAFSRAFARRRRVPVYSQPSLTVRARIVDAAVYDEMAHGMSWAAVVSVGGADVSSRLIDRLSIGADEESARVAELSLIPPSAAALAAYESASVTIDWVVFSPAGTAIFRRFTGVVETVDFSPAARVATLRCRDGYQERIKACASAEAVEAQFGGLATVCTPLVAWADSKPDPAAYFSALLATVPGSVFIDGAGLWRAFRWDVGTAVAEFSAGDVFDESVNVEFADRSGLPSAIDATLTVRVNRLHSVELPISWDGISYNLVGLGLGSWPTKSVVIAALDGLTDWVVKGSPVMTSPQSAYVIHNSTGGQFAMSLQNPEMTCTSLDATLYHRWYQTIDYVYTASIPVDGSSDRDTSIAESIATTWDASAWETAPAQKTDVGIYAKNPPVAEPSTKTGYEALPGPWPPANGAADYHPDIPLADIQAAARFVAARAIRLAAQGRRQRRVSFARPLEPRWDISAVIAVAADGVSARGQVVSWDDEADFSAGSATTSFTLACPDGTGDLTGVETAVVPDPSAADVSHSPAPPALGNWFGSANTMEIVLDEWRLQGWLANISGTAAQFDESKPVYNAQFRIVMPAVPAPLRDPATISQPLAVEYSLAAGDLFMDF